jgi:hypothetical protein
VEGGVQMLETYFRVILLAFVSAYGDIAGAFRGYGDNALGFVCLRVSFIFHLTNIT